MQTDKTCETCGKPVAAGAPSGICPGCLLRTALEYGASHAPAALLPRLRYFGDYELLEEIARGGMGVVYRARQVSLDRIVAIKMMQPGLLASDNEIQRFYTEARTAANLQHPNIVAIHEVGEFDGLHYFSMDFVEGPSLADLVRQGPVSSPEAARYLATLAETVEYAHAKGILHRDLKPSNVLLDAAGRPRITDFGLARPLHDDTAGSAAGAVIGTPAYMSPEQAAASNHSLGAPSDVYGLGAILYECLTGRPPFRGTTQNETIRQVKESAPVLPHLIVTSVDRRLEAICLRCLAKQPAARYQSAADLAADLRGYLTGRLAPPVPPLRRPRVWAYAALTAALLIVALMALLRRQPSRPLVPPRSPVSNTSPSATEPPGTHPFPIFPNTKLAPAAAVKPPIKPMAVAVSISPDQGTGYEQQFTVKYTRPEGALPIRTMELSFSDAGDAAARRCAIFVEPDDGRIRLQFYPDRAPGLTVSANLGSMAELANSVCSVDPFVSIKLLPDHLELRLTVKFKPAFDGAKQVEAWAWDNSGGRGESKVHSKWTVGNNPALSEDRSHQ